MSINGNESRKGQVMSEGNSLNQIAFESFADIYPHEAYKTCPERFLEYFKTRCPNVSITDMERLLKETESEE